MKWMNILKREAGNTLPEGSATVTADSSAHGGRWGSARTYVRSREAALSISAFYRGVELRAKTMGQLVIEAQKKSAIGGNYVADTWGNRYLNYLLQVRPNRTMTASHMQELVEIAKICDGNAYIYIERGASEVKALWYCHIGAYDQMSDTYTLTYNSPAPVTLTSVPSGDVIHLKSPFSLNGGVTGVGVLAYASQTLDLAATNDRQAIDNSAKGGKMKLLVQEEKSGGFGVGRAAKKQLEKVTEKLNDDIYQNDVVLMSNIATVTPISQNAQQMELLESRKYSVREIARLLGVPPVLLMDDSNSNYKSPEAATQEFLLRTIQPSVREMEDEMNAKLIGPEGWGKQRIHVCERNLLRLDPKTTADIEKLKLETGVKSVNELRLENDMAAVPGGDTHYVSTNLAEVGSAKLRGGEATKGEEE